MSAKMMTRRRFLETTALAAAAVGAGSPGTAAQIPGSVRIDHPVHGAVLNRHHGQVVDGGLEISVQGAAPAEQRIVVNGVPAHRDGGQFEARIVLREHESDIVAAPADAPQHGDAVRVVWDQNSRPRYRFAFDDTSFCYRDIWQNQYRSLFDCFFLALLRDLHNKYGTKFVLNTYYTTADEFDLTKFSDRYRNEWRDNAHWLKLSFHAHADQPARPYIDAPPEQLIADFDKVRDQIHRFAGEASYAPTTIVHWGEVRPSAWKPLAERGVKVLSGYFRKQGDDWPVSYRMDPVRAEHLSRHDALKDFPSGIVFSKIDMVVNTVPLDRIVPELEEIGQDPNQSEIFDLMTHEQYFWPFYSHYLPDHAQRIEAAIRWVTDRGHEPVFLHEGFLGLTG
jgi:hypothetical protein